MSQNPSSQPLMQQLSIGNVVNVALYLYRSHLRLYSQLSLMAHLWLFVPLYGWAKFFAISALISRLTFGELSGQPESVNSARSYIKSRMWSFLITVILILLMTFLAMIILTTLFVVGAFILSISLGILLYVLPISKPDKPFFTGLGGVIGILLLLVAPLSALWFYSRCFIADLPLLVETNISSIRAIKKSWKLSRGFIVYIQGIMAISFLIFLPILITTWFAIKYIFKLIFHVILPENLVSNSVINFLGWTILFLVTGVITMPFWQAIKAVVYYDIRCFRESINLNWRDSKTSPGNSNI